MAIARFLRRATDWLGQSTQAGQSRGRRPTQTLSLLVLEDRTVPSTTGLLDFGFESSALAAGAYKYDPTGAAWTYSGTAGLAANNSAFTSGNPAAPQGSQVAFVQRSGSVSQSANFAAGTYTVSFSAAQRAGQRAIQTFQVLVDGSVVGTFNSLAGTGYSAQATSSFTVAAGSHVVKFQGTNLFGGDNTVFIDQVTANQQPTSLTDSGFEAFVLGAGGSKYAPTGSPWAYSNTAGVAANNSAFTAGNPAAPQGSQVAFLQGAGSMSQSATFAAGTYTVGFSAAQRGNQASAQTFRVLVDGAVVGTFNSLTGTGYATLATSSFTVAAGSHVVKFQGTNLFGGDNTVLIDQVSVNQQPTSLGDTGFETVALGSGGFTYAPVGSAWTFGGGAGVSGNGTDFTAGNPAAPQGGQVAFLQRTGSVSQAANFAAGTYTVSFAAAQRGNQASAQTLQVLVDGNVVGTFNNLTGTGYTALTTPGFTVAAGSHVVSIQGTNLKGGDNTAFIDQVSVTQVTTSVSDPGFEALPLGAGGFTYNPAGSPWSFAGTAGVAGNGGAFTAGNAAAPQGSQVAFVQRTGSVSQTATFAAGTYVIGFAASQRGNPASVQTFQVLLDGAVVGTFNSLFGTGYKTLTTSSFTVGAGTHTIAFQGTDLNGGDNTVLIDQVTADQQPTSLTDSGFEASAVAAGAFQYGPAGAAWSFAGSAGVASNGSAFTSGNPVAPQGSQVAFLQGTGSVSQAATFAAGTYTIGFSAAQRGNPASAQTLRVLVDGAVEGTFNTLKGTAYAALATGSFTLTAGSHIVTFQGTNAAGDNTVFIDQVVVNPQ